MSYSLVVGTILYRMNQVNEKPSKEITNSESWDDMKTVDKIHQLLSIRFAPEELDVTDDSASHAGHAGARPGGQTHYSVRIVSEDFRGMNRVSRHRAVYAEVEKLFEQGLHALAINAKAPGEA